MRRGLGLWALVALILAGCSGREPAAEPAQLPEHIRDLAAPIADPATVDLFDADPELPAYLTGEGRDVAHFHGAAADLLVENPDCAAVAERLDAATSPEALLAAAESAPSEALSELLVSEYAAVGRMLGACEPGRDPADAQVQLAYQWSLVERHFLESGSGS